MLALPSHFPTPAKEAKALLIALLVVEVCLYWAFNLMAPIPLRQKAVPYFAAMAPLMILCGMYFADALYNPIFVVAVFAGAFLAFKNGCAWRICPNCGKTNRPNSVLGAAPEFCGKCGGHLDA